MELTVIKEIINIKGRELYIDLRNTHPGRPTIVFLHDSLGCVELWRDFPEKLGEATQCNILVYDRPGYGRSGPMATHVRRVDYMEDEADILHELLTSLAIAQPILFGHSDGGSIALIAAAKYPHSITALICEAAHIFVEDVTLNGIREAMEAYTTTDLPKRLERYHGDKVDTLFKAWTETWTRANFRQWNIEHVLPKISCPLLFIQGDSDEYGSLEQVEKTITKVSGNASKHILPGIGHTPHKEAAELTIHAAKDFIESLKL